MKNIEVVEQFLDGVNNSSKGNSTKNLYIKNRELINYYTTIAYYYSPTKILLNYEYYSNTTRSIQNKVLYKALDNVYIVNEERLFNKILSILKSSTPSEYKDNIFSMLHTLNDLESLIKVPSNRPKNVTKKQAQENYDKALRDFEMCIFSI